MKFDAFEKIIITDIIEQYPEYKQKLQSQFEKIVVQKREFSTSVFQLIMLLPWEKKHLGIIETCNSANTNGI